MPIEREIPPFGDWLADALLLHFPLAIAVTIVLGCFIGFLVAATRRGPVEGFYAVAQVVASAVIDLAHLSLRRTLAIATLAMQEAIRRKVLVVFAVFVVILLFAGWYLDVKSDNPARLYLSFVLTISEYLVLLLALFISTFSLPNDIKNRTIYTVVTKPVRAFEIVLGRVLGFAAIGTAVLIGMCVLSYFFVVRGLSHQHQVAVSDVRPADAGTGQFTGSTSYDGHHRHDFRLFEDGTGETNVVMGHTHDITRVGEGGGARYQVGPPIGMLQARVPVYGKLRFLDQSGKPAERGVNVGHEWEYRSYLAGGSQAAAIWTFENVTPARFPDGLTLEMNIRVFRTHKGNIEEGVRGAIEVRSPRTGANLRRSEKISFTAKEFVIDRRVIPTQLRAVNESTAQLQDVSLFDLTEDGKLEIWVRCEAPGQYYGMAGPDVYILAAEQPFAWNFLKGYISIWLQMLLVTSFGVMFSTFLSGAVAMMATLSSIVVGYFGKFISQVAAGVLEGGGPVESTIRMASQTNVSVELEIDQSLLMIIKWVDYLFMMMVQWFSTALPDYSQFSSSEFVALGYNIDAGLLGPQLLTALAYLLVVSLIGYFMLKTREVAA